MPGRRSDGRADARWRLNRGPTERRYVLDRYDMGAPIPPRKEDAPCCVPRRDELGRLPIGFCSPDCVRRP